MILPLTHGKDVITNAWERCNNMLISCLFHGEDVLHFGTAHEIWNNLEERHGQSSGSQLFSLKQALHELRKVKIIF